MRQNLVSRVSLISNLRAAGALSPCRDCPSSGFCDGDDATRTTATTETGRRQRTAAEVRYVTVDNSLLQGGLDRGHTHTHTHTLSYNSLGPPPRYDGNGDDDRA